MNTKNEFPKYKKALQDVQNGKVIPKIEFIGDSFLYQYYDPRITASEIYKYKVNLRKSKNWVIKENAKQIDGKIFSFIEGWVIDKGIYKGDIAMIPVDNNYPNDAPSWIALKDLEYIENN